MYWEPAKNIATISKLHMHQRQKANMTAFMPVDLHGLRALVQEAVDAKNCRNRQVPWESGAAKQRYRTLPKTPSTAGIEAACLSSRRGPASFNAQQQIQSIFSCRLRCQLQDLSYCQQSSMSIVR